MNMSHLPAAWQAKPQRSTDLGQADPWSQHVCETGLWGSCWEDQYAWCEPSHVLSLQSEFSQTLSSAARI